MSTNEITVRDPLYGDLTTTWKWMLGLGVLMAVLGVIGLGMTYWLTILSVVWFGILALIGGIAQLIDAFKCSGWKSVASHVLVGLLYLAAGVVLIAMPVQSAWWLTLMIGAVFVVTGVLRIVMALQMRGHGSATVWLVLSGLISIGLGVMIYYIVDLPTTEAMASLDGARGWFEAWGWVIGMFVALEFIVHGAALVALALAARARLDSSEPPAGGTAATA
ncbi:DUF308 domain-containing protein [Acuticoccus sp. MNP-M23]|uniref:HdeD family acid-resistance protein n=1 Tax=Acuticoccus sp. MNP-M23 TaxID=3072793 RepID=UPI0028167D47|nr:DUF308 domain-containing protein [Acuticoccus sp. MNP-M23]WMS42023.1 DUF308 domain-containing protein [Acuticoccus sp. MNP-M23]